MAYLSLIGINHICIVTRELDRAVRVWSDRYGVGPWRLYTYDADNMSASVDGESVEFGMRVGLCQFGPATRVEIIQPLDELSPYAESLTMHDGADHLHHIRVDVGDHLAARAGLAELDVHTVLHGEYQSGDPAIRSSATYHDTEADLGFMLEVAHMPPGYRIPEPESVYPAPTE
jgi:methylmalonyl-CoA/ethylmalonyl-CoA epimerase